MATYLVINSKKEHSHKTKLIYILLSYRYHWYKDVATKGILSSWEVHCPENLKSISGSCLLIPCSFNYPNNVQPTNGITMIWYKNVNTEKLTVYHPTDDIDPKFQGRVEILGDYNQKNCTLLIRNMRSEDTGTYNFRFEFGGTNNWLGAKGARVEVAEVAPIIPEVVSPPHIGEGESVTFQCSTPYYCPDSPTVLEWRDNVPERSAVQKQVQLDTSTVLLQQNLTTSFTWQEDQKTISCEVAVGLYKTAKEIRLNVIHSPKEVKALIKPSEDNIKQGTFVTLTCQVISSNPAAGNFTWYKNGKLISREQSVLFPSVSRQDHGEYRCEAQNTVGITTSEPASLVIFSANITMDPSTDIKEGEAVTFTCEVPGAKPEEIHYSWFKNNIWMKEGSGKSLIFHKISITDTGYYNCKVQNDKGSDTSPPVALNVLYPPRIPTLSSFLETQEGKLAIIECTVDSNPLSDLHLYRNEQFIANTTFHSAPTQRLSVTSSRNSLKLKIQEVKLSDKGNYRCFAKNSVGNSTTSLQFIVETARVVITPSSQIREGIEVSLTCLATRNSEKGSTYIWYKNGKLLKEDLEDNKLVLHRVSRSDAGSYYCIVQNSQGSSISVPSTLHVLFSPNYVKMTSMVTTQGGSLGIIHCSVDSDPPSELFFYRKNILIATNIWILPQKRYTVFPFTNALKLEIQDVLIEDEGMYTCLANNSYGNAAGSLEFTAETAKVTIVPSSSVREGDLVNITCVLSSASNKEMYLYSWYKNSMLYAEGPEHSLIFQQVTSDDSGSYFCKAGNNETSKNSAFVSLNVEYAPRHTQLKSFVDTEDGRLAFIHCTVDSYPPAELSLYRQKELVASTVKLSTFNQRYSVSFSSNSIKLEIKNVEVVDEGEYVCNSRNTIGSASESIYFKVQPARILVQPSPEVLEGEKVTLTCDLINTQLEGITYSWYKNSRWLQDGIESSLVFERIQSSDTGYYHCRAHNTQDSNISPSVSLHVSYAPREPIMSSFWETANGQVGIIQCSVDSDPPSMLALYRKQKLVASTDSIKTSDQKIKVSSSHNSLELQITEVMLEDEGEYICTANNSIGSSRSTVNFTAETTRIQIMPSSTVLEGEMVNLTCVATVAEPDEATYMWYKNGAKYGVGNTKEIVIDKVSSDDEGSYYCAVQTEQGTKSSLSITLNVMYAPRNARIKSFLETLGGKVAIIVCSVDSNPPPEITLFKEDQLIASSTSNRVTSNRVKTYFSLDTLRLEITNVMLSDEGTYIFKAKNTHGTTTASVEFTVEGARVLANPSTLQEGGSVTLTCEVLSNSHLVTSYAWYKNSKWFQEGSVGSLVFQSVSVSDAASYSCTAHSSEGTSTSPPTTLNVLYTPRQISLTSFLETQEKRQGVILCSVESEPPSQLTLYRGDEMLVSSNPPDSNQHLKLSISHNSLRLEIYDIIREDIEEYICRANNSLGAAEKSIHFNVETARVAVFPSTELREGTTLNLTCEISSETQEKAIYTWYKNNKWLKEGSDVSLILPSVTISDGGSYHCLAQHGNSSSISPMVGIDVLYGPRNLLMTSFIETLGREQGIILCSADSVPASVIGLYKDGVLLADTTLSQGDQGQKFRASSSYNYLRLEIRDITAEDSGTYVCTASNPLGSENSSIIFTIKDREVLIYKVITWTVIVIILILVAALIAVIYWKKIKEKSLLHMDRQSIEMENKEAAQNGH